MPVVHKARLHFPGLRKIKRWEGSVSHGISPNVWTVTVAPQDSVPARAGDLVLEYDGRTITFAGCLIDSASMVRNNSGQLIQVQILDRRWMWDKLPLLFGAYNLRLDETNRIVKTSSKTDRFMNETEKSPRQLCELCLEKMGERGYDVREVPNESRPPIDWDGENPAAALSELARKLGCRVVLGLNGRVRVCLDGRGAQLPRGGTIENGFSYNPPDVPETIKLYGGPTRYQVTLKLEPIGEESDHTLKKLDDLSYKPSGGWEKADVPHFNAISDKKLRALAQRCVLRWYRIKTPFKIPGLKDSIEDIWRILPLETSQIDLAETEDGRSVEKEAEVFGVWYKKDDLGENTATKFAWEIKPETKYERGFSIDAGKGIVKFSEAMYQIKKDGANYVYAPAEIALKVAITLKSKELRQANRFQEERKLKGGFTGLVLNIKQDDVQREVKCTYTSESKGDYTDNEKDCKKAAKHYLDALEAGFQPVDAASAVYSGIRYVELDGAIQQVAFSGGTEVPTTRVARNFEIPDVSISYEERLLLERVRKVDELSAGVKANEIAKRAARGSPGVKVLQ